MTGSSDSDAEEIGPEDGTIEIDREAMLKRMQSHDVWKTTPLKAVVTDSTTASVQIPTDVLRKMAIESPNDYVTLDIPIHAVEDEEVLATDTAKTVAITAVGTIEFTATIDEFGVIQIPKEILKGNRLAGQRVQIEIKPAS